MTVQVLLPRRLAATCALLRLFRCDDLLFERRMRYVGLFRGCDLYEAELSLGEPDIYFYSFSVGSAFGHFSGGRAGLGNGVIFSRDEDTRRFQITVSDFAYPAPSWLYGGVIYHIFVDRFLRKGTPPVRKDAVINPDWENGIPEYPEYPGAPLENNEFFGGNLDGITDRLDELLELGVSCLYLSPIFEAYSNHKYDIGDYERIDAMLGGEEAFLRLLDAAAKRGIRVVLDGVFNHTGSDSVYFNKKGRYPSIGAYQSKKSPYYDWYRFYEHPDRYESWWGIDILPRLDPAVPSLRRFFVGEGGVIDRYARLGIGGLRLDVVDELTDDFVADIKRSLVRRVPDAVLYGEVWEDASSKVAYGVRKHYYTGRELDGVMNYPLRTGLVEYFTSGATERLRYALCEVLPNMPKRIADATMNLLGSHDTARILTLLGGKSPAGKTMAELATERLTREEYRRARGDLILAYLVLATLPGVPAIYYGDEVGLEGYSDPFNRRPYPWHKRDGVLLAAYRHIGKMRRHESCFRTGRFRLLLLSPELLIFERYSGRRAILVAVNRSPLTARLVFDGGVRVLFGHGCGEDGYLLARHEGAAFGAVRGRRLRVYLDDIPVVFENM